MTVSSQITYNSLMSVAHDRGAGFLMLIDPDRTDPVCAARTAETGSDCGVDAFLIGSSFSLGNSFSATILAIKEATNLPTIIFPGSFAQITPEADAILFTSLISGRNPNYLIDEQVKGAPIIKKYNLETIPTGYMLIESGALTSVQFVSGTQPIPRDKSDIASAHALAAQYMGMRMIYLEAGSGAEKPVPTEMVAAVSAYVDIPIIVGGGLRSPDACIERVNAGASFVVIGNSLEQERDKAYLLEMAAAIHTKEIVTV
ncbi:MAG: geranylgeranylglyceryl/heptaprenylglyceryl phosphate synthase [bacterium]|nr:geranylgeranylglyceryl/heptaprenylglyceryl phosphate synthase [bacterium]